MYPLGLGSAEILTTMERTSSVRMHGNNYAQHAQSEQKSGTPWTTHRAMFTRETQPTASPGRG